MWSDERWEHFLFLPLEHSSEQVYIIPAYQGLVPSHLLCGEQTPPLSTWVWWYQVTDSDWQAWATCQEWECVSPGSYSWQPVSWDLLWSWEKSLSPSLSLGVCSPWNHQVSHPRKLQFGKRSANTVHTCTGTWLTTLSWMCIQTRFSDWFSSKIPILNTERSPPWAQFRDPFSVFQSFFSGNEQLK